MSDKFPHFDSLAFRKNPYKGKLIVIEGIDGAGKTTQAKKLVEKLVAAGHDALYTKEPTENVIGKFIREKILAGHVKVSHLALQYLFNADRVMHMEEIEKFLEEGKIVVMDRYFWSSVAYAMSDMNKPQEWYYMAFSILSFYHEFLLPDATFFLQIDPSLAMSRIEKSNKHNEIYDTKSYLEKIEKNYQQLMREFPDTFTAIDASMEEEAITNQLAKKAQPLL